MGCAGRELEEEAGYRAHSLKKVTKLYSSPGFTDEVAYVFAANGLERGRQELEPMENIKVKVFPVREVLRLIDDKKIDSSLHVAAFLSTLRVY